ncbi:MAG: sodium:calcium antiporter [Candidatus Micrarchaeia archaeon]
MPLPSILWDFLTLLISLAVLGKTAELVISNATKLSRFFGISELAVGFVFVSVFTTLPELSVSISAASAHEGAIAIGNAFGSNIANICIILGVSASLYGVPIQRKEVPRLLNILLITSAISILLLLREGIGRIEGIVLLLTFSFYVYYLLSKKIGIESNNSESITKHEALHAFLLFCIGIMGVIISAGLVVDSSVKVADTIGISKTFIGATIVAVGTSLPELAVITTGFRKKRPSLALGNAFGSCMTNLTLVLGSAALFSPSLLNIAVFMTLVLSLLLVNLVVVYILSTRKIIGRNEGIVLLLLYCLFIFIISGVQLAYR